MDFGQECAENWTPTRSADIGVYYAVAGAVLSVLIPKGMTYMSGLRGVFTIMLKVNSMHIAL